MAKGGRKIVREGKTWVVCRYLRVGKKIREFKNEEVGRAEQGVEYK